MEKIRFEREKEESERTKMRVEREQRDVQRRDLQRHKPDRYADKCVDVYVDSFTGMLPDSRLTDPYADSPAHMLTQ